jgi:xylitol oxidase
LQGKRSRTCRRASTFNSSNWARTLTYQARTAHEPASVREIQYIVRSARLIRPIGSRHSFSDIADTAGDHISPAALPRTIAIDPSRTRVRVDGGVRYGELAQALHAAGLGLRNLASLAHISVVGACVTATHGSGDRNGSLASAVRALRIVRADGEIETVDAGTPDGLSGCVVSLGALGVVVELTLEVEPTYDVRQTVYEDLPFETFTRHLDAIFAAADSVSCFTDWRRPLIDQVWLKSRVASPDDRHLRAELFGARPAAEQRHPIRGMSPDACTVQGGIPGPWHERLPHFRLDHTPSAGREIQSEYFVARQDAVHALGALRPLADRIAGVIQVSEFRTVAADDLWLSPAHGRDSLAIHFTWLPDPAGVLRVLPAIEAALEPFDPRPHWAKVFTMAPDRVRARYARADDFVRLATRFDPDGKFRNDFLRRYLFG